MATHGQVVAKLLRRQGIRKEVERIEREEGALLDRQLEARHEAGSAVVVCGMLKTRRQD